MKTNNGKPLSPAKDSEWIRWENEQEEFYKAKEFLLFEGFWLEDENKYSYWLQKEKFNNDLIFVKDGILIKNKIEYNGVGVKTIEDLIPYNLTLTKNALNK